MFISNQSERDDIEYVEVRACLFTSSSTAAEGWFDNITISSIHLASDTARTMNIHNTDYNDYLEYIDDEIFTEHGSSPTVAEKSEVIYDCLIDNISDDGNICSFFTDLGLIQNFDSGYLYDCSQIAILTSAIGRAFNIPARVVYFKYEDSEAGDHFFAEFYWSNSWYIVDPDTPNFNDAADMKTDHVNANLNATFCSLIYEYFVAADPRGGSTSLNSNVVYYRDYVDNPYINIS